MLLAATCIGVTVNRTHCCTSMATLSILTLLTASLSVIITKGTHCCVSMTTTVTRTRYNVTSYVHCLFNICRCFYDKRFRQSKCCQPSHLHVVLLLQRASLLMLAVMNWNEGVRSRDVRLIIILQRYGWRFVEPCTTLLMI